MRKPKRRVVDHINAVIAHEGGNSKTAPPGGYARGLNLAEAQLVYLTVRKTRESLGLPLKDEWSPANAYQRQRWISAYVNRGLDPTPLDI